MLCMSMWQWESQETNILIALLGQGYLQSGTCSATIDCDSIQFCYNIGPMQTLHQM